MQHVIQYFIAVRHSVTLSSSKLEHVNEHHASLLLFEIKSAMPPLTHEWAMGLQWEQGWCRSRGKSRHSKWWFNMSGELELAMYQQSSLLQLTPKKKTVMKWICEMAHVCGSKWETEKQIELDPVKKNLGQPLHLQVNQTGHETAKRGEPRKQKGIRIHSQSSWQHTAHYLGFGKGRHGTGHVVQLFILLFFPLYLPIWLFFGQVSKKTAFTCPAALTDSFLSVCQKAAFHLFQLAKSWDDQMGDYRANPLECEKHDRTLKGEY